MSVGLKLIALAEQKKLRKADLVDLARQLAARTGESDDGQVFVSEVTEAIRISNYQRDEAAV